MPALALKNDKSIDASRSEYTKLYASVTSWGNIVALNLGLPALRGYWPMNIANENDDTIDLSNQEHTLTHYP
jgi:hypothetical protein